MENSGHHFQSALSINNKLEMNLCWSNVKISKLSKFCFPTQINFICQIEEVCGIVIDTNNASQLLEETFVLNLKLVLYLLLPYKCDSNKFFAVISFTCEQIDFLAKRKVMYRYSNEFRVLAYNLTPHGYRFLRNSGTYTLYSTLLFYNSKSNSTSSINPSNEQTDTTFLLYLKQQLTALTESDISIVLLVDEIHLHLKSFYDCTGGSIVESSHNIIDAVTSAFVLMVSSVLSNYKDVAHVFPSSKTSADALHGFYVDDDKKVGTTRIPSYSHNHR